MLNFNLDLAVECVKTISDNTQCVSCDKLIGPCVRFSCGHSFCEGCAERAGECLFCVGSSATYLVDRLQTGRLNDTSALLTAFQDTYQLDVYKRQRISDHLKAEKLMFPECIQAPHKYCNKRKSLNTSLKNKENICPTIYPGEEVIGSDTVTMKKSFQYVQNWLNQHEIMPQNLPRQPLGNINVNTQKVPKNSKKEANQPTHRKKTHLKSIYKTSSLLSSTVEPNLENKDLKSNKDMESHENCQIIRKCDKNESGIVLDDEVIIIEDGKIVDKDKQAWLAVLEQADKDENKEKESLKANKSQNRETDIYMGGPVLVKNGIESKKMGARSVLFYKRSSLSETCKLCNNYFNNQPNSNSKVEERNDVSIVITNPAFVTTIQFKNCEENQTEKCDKSSVAIQTDTVIPVLKPEIITGDRNITPQKRKNMSHEGDGPSKMLKTSFSESLDVFTNDKPKELEKESNYHKPSNENYNYLKPQKCLIIEDSDTDSNNSCDNTHEVVVEVHNVECGVLNPLSKGEYQQRTKRQVRGTTPNSSNSSDKENLDPNRKKVVKTRKKPKNKK